MSSKIPPDDCAQLVTALGNSDFPAKLLNALQVICQPDHLSFVHLAIDDKASYLFCANREKSIIHPELQQLYLSTYYQYDPNRALLDDAYPPNTTTLLRLRPEEIDNGGYRQLWYEKMGIVDRLSIIYKADKGLYCLNLFRNKSHFETEALQRIESEKHLLTALVTKHSRMSGDLSSFMTRETQIDTLIARLSTINASLSTREKEVGARILLGMNSEGIALDLGIKTHSVHTYRKRAYSRMNISSQNELFALCLTIF